MDYASPDFPSHVSGGVLIKNYSSLPALALMLAGQASRRKKSWLEDAKEATRTPFATADTNTQHR